MSETNRLAYSVVVPILNEADALARLAGEIVDVMDSLGKPYECLFVDDGSTDATVDIIESLIRRPDSTVRCLRFESHHGQGAALHHGLRNARGDVIITMDGDGQNAPVDIPDLIAALERRRLDMVCGFRVDRHDSMLRRGMSRLANVVRSRVLRDGVRDSGCALKVMRRAVVPALLPIRTLYSFVPALAVAGGFTVGEHPVLHRPRQGGRSSYGLQAFLWRPFVDMLGVRWYQARCVLRSSDSDSSPSEEHAQTQRSGMSLADEGRAMSLGESPIVQKKRTLAG